MSKICKYTLFEDGVLVSEYWRDRDTRSYPHYHREEGPAVISYSPETGVATCEEYYVNGKLHRVDGPAYVVRDPETNVVYTEQYYINGELHRDLGPAYIVRNPKTGDVTSESCYLNGKAYRKKDPKVELQKKKNQLNKLAKELGVSLGDLV